MQISAVVNAAIAKLTAAGAVLVPFDSTPFDQANAAAMESVSYESGDAFSRYVSSWEPAWIPLMCRRGNGGRDQDICLPGMVGWLVVAHAPSWLGLSSWCLLHAPPVADLHSTDLCRSPLYLMHQC